MKQNFKYYWRGYKIRLRIYACKKVITVSAQYIVQKLRWKKDGKSSIATSFQSQIKASAIFLLNK